MCVEKGEGEEKNWPRHFSGSAVWHHKKEDLGHGHTSKFDNQYI